MFFSLSLNDNDSFHLSKLSSEKALEGFLNKNRNMLFASDKEALKHTQVIAIFCTYLSESILKLDTFVIATISVTTICQGEWVEVKRGTWLLKANYAINKLSSTRIYCNTYFAKEEMQ